MASAIQTISGQIQSQPLNDNFSYLNERKNDIAINVKDYSAKGDGVTDDTVAIQAAVTAANGGTVLFPKGTFNYTVLTLPVNTILWGAGRENTILNYTGLTKGIGFPAGIGRCSLMDLSLKGTNVGVGVDFDGSYFNVLERVNIWNFNIGMRFNNIAAFTARNYVHDFEINDCKRGIQAYVNSNFNYCGNGRLYDIVDAGAGIGIDVNNADVIAFDNVSVETADLCLKVDGTSTIASFDDCYLEPGTGNNAYQLLNAKKLRWKNVQCNASQGMIWKIPLDTLVDFDGRTSPYSGAAVHGGNSAFTGYIKNSDMSRGNFLYTLNSNLTTTEDAVNYVIGGKALKLTPGGGTPTLSNLSQSFTVKSGVNSVTVMVRFKNLSSTQAVFNVVNSAITYQYVSSAVSTDWEIVAITAEIGATKTVAVNLYPDTLLGTGEILIDSVWAVDGRYAPSFRQYYQFIELLSTPEVIFSGVTTANIGDAARTSAKIPNNAVGMVLEISVKGSAAATYATYVTVNGTLIYGFVNNQETVVEQTVVGTSVTSGVIVTNGANSVTYSIKIKSWILE